MRSLFGGLLVGGILFLGWYFSGFFFSPDVKNPPVSLVSQVKTIQQKKQVKEVPSTEQAFARFGLSTDTSIASIDLKDILDGGPGKDGIPPIDKPIFITQQQVVQDMSYLHEQDKGIVVVGEQEQRFYPYAIMNRHEIVNDELDGQFIAVTFCPLCGSAIVFDRTVDGQVLRMGVSGKLFQSNLLMYDDVTESLWSQARGKGVVGQFTNTKLTHVSSDVVTYGEFTHLYPEGLILSDDTDHRRNYAQAPYGDYDVNDQLFFPIENADARLPKKEILYVVNDADVSVAFVKEALKEIGEASLDIDGAIYTAMYRNGNISVKKAGIAIPGYHEMFFSWATHNPKSKNIWISEE